MTEAAKVNPITIPERAQFLKVPSYYIIPDGKGHWISTGKLVFYSKKLDRNICIPARSINNLASIPPPLRHIFAVNGPHRPAAALHDGLYGVGGLLANCKLSRKKCDIVFKEAMDSSFGDYINCLPQDMQLAIYDMPSFKFKRLNQPLVPAYKSKLMYRGVRLGGAYHFK